MASIIIYVRYIGKASLLSVAQPSQKKKKNNNNNEMDQDIITDKLGNLSANTGVCMYRHYCYLLQIVNGPHHYI